MALRLTPQTRDGNFAKEKSFELHFYDRYFVHASIKYIPPIMPPSKLSYGLNLPNKKQPPSLNKPGLAPGQKRKKTIFDSDSEDEGRGEDNNNNDGAVEISTIGGLEVPVSESEPVPGPIRKPTIGTSSTEPPAKRKLGEGSKNKSTFKPLNKNSIFADDDEYEGTSDVIPGMGMGMKDSKSQKKVTGTNKDYTNLSALHSSKKHAQEAQELDPSIYSYDAVYDSIHAKKEKSSNATDTKSEGPRYMTSLLRSAEIRKRDQLRARDRLLAKEREAEGDEFTDKEKFVTAAYKAQQEEMRRIEEEDAKREKEEEERRRKNGGVGMVGFYRDILTRGEQRHEEAVKAAEEAAKRVKAGDHFPKTEETGKTSEEKTEAQIAAELNARGANIIVNDEGQVVDKRQLLSAGLNVAPKPKQKPSAPAADAATSRLYASRAGPAADSHSSRAAQRARQTDMIAAQLEERTRQAEETEAARQRELAERNRSRKTAGDVSSARERYLARKREREEAERREKEKTS